MGGWDAHIPLRHQRQSGRNTYLHCEHPIPSSRGQLTVPGSPGTCTTSATAQGAGYVETCGSVKLKEIDFIFAGYFTSLVGGEDSGTLQWDRAPKCLVQARELMVHEARTYGEIENCTVGELVTFAWATTGKGKVSFLVLCNIAFSDIAQGPVLHAREGLVTILCLGADAAFTLTPKLDGVVPNTPLSEALPGDNDSMILFDSAVHAGLIESTRVDGAVVHRKDAAATKTSHDSLVVTMVHGDVLVLENSNFEVYIFDDISLLCSTLVSLRLI